MVNTQLSLEVSDNLNLKTLRLFDTSFYFRDETVENYLVEVLPVNKSVWLTFEVKKKFSLVLNSSNLKYKKATSNDDLIDLPDGIYEFKVSIKPNLLTVGHYYHFRVVELIRSINKQRTKLIKNECKLDREDYIRNRDWLRDIEEYVLAAKWMLEEEHDKKKAKELYDFAEKQIERYTNECQC